MLARIGLVADGLSVLLAAWIAWWWVAPETQQPLLYVVISLSTVLCFAWFAALLGLYHSVRAVDIGDWLAKMSSALLLVVLLTLGILWALKRSDEVSRLWLGLWWLLIWLYALIWRILGFRLLRYARARGYQQKTLVIVGAGHLGDRIAKRIQANPDSGFVLHAWFDDDPDKIGKTIHNRPVIAADQLADWLTQHAIDEVWFALPLSAEPRLQTLLHSLRHSTANIRYVPDFSGLRLLNHAPRRVLGLSVLDLSVSPMSEPAHRWLKNMEDKVLSVIILLGISPLMLILAMAVKLSSSGPVFYRQERVGLNGQPFMMLKFRSMPVDVEKTGVQWGNASAKTTTWLGVFIRKTSLDELPQFINVLKGDMSIVGPRPERTQFVESFKHEIPGYMQKHMVKAGITGWAQIHGWRGDTDLHTRIEYDLWYIEHWSLWLDIKIIMLTLVKGLGKGC